MNLDALADAYFRHNEEDFWAWEEVQRAVDTDLNTGWEMLLLLLQRAPSESDVGYVAAGPLEDLIDRYGHKALDLAEEECKNNSHLRVALSTVAVLFYYDEFDRWYGLLYQYGFPADRVADNTVIDSAMGIMESYLCESINVHEYAYRLTEVLDKPFEDKTVQRILQSARFDVEVIDAKRPPNYSEPYITEPELKVRVKQAIAELEHLGYQGNSIN